MTYTTTPLAPTAEAVNEWLGRTKRRPDGSLHGEDEHFGVDVRTKSGQWRCIIGQGGMGMTPRGDVWGWWTIRGEGSSNGCRETWVSSDRIVEARGHHHQAWSAA